MSQPTVGMTATLTHRVGADDTAIAVGSGDVPVLGTPRLVALAEAATVAAIAGVLPEGATSVGTRVRLDHQRASGLGARVSVTARLADVAGPRLTFVIVAEQDEHGQPRQVAAGEVDRVVLDRDTFVSRVPPP